MAHDTRVFYDDLAEDHWKAGQPVYDLDHIVMREAGPTWTTRSGRATYRAWRREELQGLAAEAGFDAVRWQMPEESGFYQPILSASAESHAA